MWSEQWNLEAFQAYGNNYCEVLSWTTIPKQLREWVKHLLWGDWHYCSIIKFEDFPKFEVRLRFLKLKRLEIVISETVVYSLFCFVSEFSVVL